MTQQLNRWQGMDFEMEEIGGGDRRHTSGSDTRPMQIALVFGAGRNCVGYTVGREVNARQSAEGKYTTIN